MQQDVINNVHNFNDVQIENLLEDDSDSVQFFKPPITKWVYTDIQQKCTFVNVALPVFSGSQDITFSIHEDGMKVSIHFSWTQELYVPEQLLAHEIYAINGISLNHPMVHSLATHLLDSGYTEKSIPRSKITITLPLKVQRDVGTWTKYALTTERGSKIILLKFKGYQENQIIKDADTSLIF